MPMRTDGTMRVLFAGGTTGGHLMPGIAVAEALREVVPGTRCAFLVTGHRAERHCRGALRSFEHFDVPPTPVHGWKSLALLPARAAASAAQCNRLIKWWGPDVVVALGGHNSVVPALVAKALRKKLAVFESNAIPGRAVRLLAPLADATFVQWAACAERLRGARVLVTGNPVRRRIFSADRAWAARRLGLKPDRPTLLAMGGSQGALALNRALLAALDELFAKGLRFQVVHLTGLDHLAEALRSRANFYEGYRAIGFLERMEDAYAASDFVLARAGGSTLAELTALGLPAVLVPYPHAADQHQRANAAVLEKARAAIVIPQKELTVRRLADTIQVLLENERLRRQMADASRQLGRPEAARTVAIELARMAGFARPVRLEAASTARAKQASKAA